MLTLIGQKKTQSQKFLENGKRIPVTLVDVKGNTVVSVKTIEKDHYQAIQLGFSMKKKATRAEIGHAKGAKLEKAPKFLREVRVVDADEILPEIGVVLNPSEIFAPGDIVDVSGVSKGKGFQGGVKRYGFRGGPKTHGQSDRHRAPGSIGQGTTPGRVYKGKRMAGRMGSDNVTIQNLEIVDVTNDGILVIKGLVPGIINGLIVVNKVGEDKHFVPLQKTPEQLAAEEAAQKEAEESSSAKASEGQEAAMEVSEATPVEGAVVEEVNANSKEEIKAEEAKVEEVSDEEISSVEVVAKANEEANEVKNETDEIKDATIENSGEPKEKDKDGE